MLAIISLPSLWMVVFVFRVAIIFYSDRTPRTFLRFVCGNSTVCMHHTQYYNICSVCTNRTHATPLRLSVLGIDVFWTEISPHSTYSTNSLPTSLSHPPLEYGRTYQALTVESLEQIYILKHPTSFSNQVSFELIMRNTWKCLYYSFSNQSKNSLS
jgi:hypothetical protein